MEAQWQCSWFPGRDQPVHLYPQAKPVIYLLFLCRRVPAIFDPGLHGLFMDRRCLRIRQREFPEGADAQMLSLGHQ
jgi:hypothetical protein